MVWIKRGEDVMNSAKRDPKTGKWSIQYRYTDWQGIVHKSTKRGFKTKKEAEGWLNSFLLKQAVNLNMKMKDFVELYMDDCRPRLRQNTMESKEYIIKDTHGASSFQRMKRYG